MMHAFWQSLTAGAFPLLDQIALVWFLIAIIGYGHYASLLTVRSRSIMGAMDQYRLRWMTQMLKRDNRMVDTSALRNLQQSIIFLASTSMLIIAGLSTLLSYRMKAIDILSHLPFAAQMSPMLYDIKILNLIIIFIYGFFKFTWAMRTHNYANIMIAAAPLHHERPETHADYALRAATLTTNGARHFNSGLRAYYYALVSLSWFMNGLVFMVATTLVIWVIYRREFRSKALATLHDPFFPCIHKSL